MSFVTFTAAILFGLIAGMLIFSASVHRNANRVLGTLFLLYAIQMAVMTMRLEGEQVQAYLLNTLIGMSIGPVIWLYCQAVLNTTAKLSLKKALHALPAVLLMAFEVLDIALHQLKDIAILISMAAYAVSCFKLLDFKSEEISGYEEYFCRFMFYFLCFLIVIDASIAFEYAFVDEQTQSNVLTIALLMFSLIGLLLTAAIMGRAEFILWLFKKRYSSSTKSQMSESERDRILESLEAFIQSNAFALDESWTVSQVADKAGTSARKLSEALNQHHGKTFPQYINELRIEAAKVRLRTTDEPILNIMLDVGFKTKSNFNKAFFNAVGMSPNDYRGSAK